MKSYLRKCAAITVLLISQYPVAFGQGHLPPYFYITSDTTTEYKFATEQYQILPDKTGKLSIDDVKNGPVSELFFSRAKTPVGTDTLVNTSWYRYGIKNNLDKEISISLFTQSVKSDFFIFRDNEQTHYKNGFAISWDDKDGLPASNIIPLKLKAGEQLIIYNRVENDLFGTQYSFEVKILNTEKYAFKLLDEMQTYVDLGTLIASMFGGFCLLAALFNFIFFVIDKQKIYLYFSLFLFVLAALSSPIYSVVVLRYFPEIALTFGMVAGWVSAISFIQFIRYYFQTFLYTTNWDKVLVVLILLQPTTILSLYGITPFWFSSVILYFAMIIGCGGTLFLYYRLKHITVKPFFIAILPFIIASLLNVGSIVLRGTNWVSDELGNVLSIVFPLWLLSIIWLVLYFTWILFQQYDRQKRAIIQHALDAERMAKEKEIERNILIEQKKVELEKTVHDRTAELRNSLENLKATQSQLIQSEKMASLGELTAGIAHEIQNPLNFVNNFSEVNTELIAEMKAEIEKGNYDEVKALAKDVEENEQKINHHGKRAGDIVKGMLQHSRSSSGVKEPTNLNALADEYLRLAYHGLRAKDKSFNATLKTEFDESIGNINITPQDIGRVILNLITNAFYATNEKRTTNNENYEPTVSVVTKKEGNKVLISVKDNGNGIPQKILDKIFQPFFTTKPTGQGTGLGLSLSYDIVKAHGGVVKVETKEGEGSEFIIQIPDR